MPIIRVEMFKGRDRDQKRKMVEALTNAMIETTGAKREAAMVWGGRPCSAPGGSAVSERNIHTVRPVANKASSRIPMSTR